MTDKHTCVTSLYSSRRLKSDDGRGLSEPLDEDMCGTVPGNAPQAPCQKQVVWGRARLLLSGEAGMEERLRTAMQLREEPWALVGVQVREATVSGVFVLSGTGGHTGGAEMAALPSLCRAGTATASTASKTPAPPTPTPLQTTRAAAVPLLTPPVPWASPSSPLSPATCTCSRCSGGGPGCSSCV